MVKTMRMVREWTKLGKHWMNALIFKQVLMNFSNNSKAALREIVSDNLSKYLCLIININTWMNLVDDMYLWI